MFCQLAMPIIEPGDFRLNGRRRFPASEDPGIAESCGRPGSQDTAPVHQVILVGQILTAQTDTVLTAFSEAMTKTQVECGKPGCASDRDPFIGNVANGI